MRTLTFWTTTFAVAAALAAAPGSTQAAAIVGTYSFGADGFTGAGVVGSPVGSLRGQLTVELRDDAQGIAGFAPGSSFALPLNPLDALLAFEASFTGAGLVPAAHFELDEVTDIVIADEGTFARSPASLGALPARFFVIARDSDTGVDLNFFATALPNKPADAGLIGPAPIRPGLSSAAPFAVLGLVAPEPPGPGSPVPEPGSFWLAAGAVLALAGTRRPVRS